MNRIGAWAPGLVGLSLMAPAVAWAAPNDGYAMSNDGALRGGAAMVLGRDAASVWYNPASVAYTNRFRFDASATAYGLKSTRAPGSMVARPGARVVRSRGLENQLQVVPSSATFAFGWPQRKFAVAASFHTPVFSETETRQQIAGRNRVGDYGFTQELNAIAIVRRYHFGLTMAWQPREEFRIGATLAAVYDRSVGFSRFVADADDETTGASASYIGDLDATSRIGGADFAIGMQGQLTSWLHAAATFRTPALTVWQDFGGGQTVGVSVVEPNGQTFTETTTDPSSTGGAPRWFTPWTVGAGLGVHVDRLDLEVNAEASPPRRTESEVWRRRAVWNVRAGASYRLSRRWLIGTGLYTDRTTSAVPGTFPRVILHRYGGSIGLRLRSPVKLARSERVRRLVFETTVALRYAFGLGDTGTIEASYPDGGPHLADLDSDQRVQATQHLVNLHVGTGVKF